MIKKIVDSLASLGVLHVRELDLAGVEGGMSEVQLFQGEAPPSPRAEEGKLPARRVKLVDEEGDFDLILAGLKSECILTPCSGDPEGQDSIAEEGGDSAV